ncbi:MAG: helix-turn-helix transcriptional regulator [Eubacterium sp.]|nr:helix-turn-helix transcriptional regulator [Eubacterium sp.]
MKLIGNGLERGSYMHFYTPSGTAKRLYYYPLCAGEFYCNDEYEVNREQYNSYLIICVLDGKIKHDGITVKGGEALLVDCYKPHRYYSDTSAHTLWLHFDGGNSRELFEEIIGTKGKKIKCPDFVSRNIFAVMNADSEAQQSEAIFKMLMRMLDMQNSANEATLSSTETAKEYIKQNYQNNLSVSQIARAVNLSPSYFSRIFKDNTALSPYDYLLSVRLDKAKELLINSHLPVSEIAYRCGFNSTSNFICFFKKETCLSPLKFRKIIF